MEIVGGRPGSTPKWQALNVLSQNTQKKDVWDRDMSSMPISVELSNRTRWRSQRPFYEEQGWSIFDVSATHSYDLLCTSATGKELHVEVKGTTSDGTQILLTANDVTHAQNFYPNIALFILSHIRVASTAPTKLEGGEIQCLEPWNIGEGTLVPLAFSYRRGK